MIHLIVFFGVVEHTCHDAVSWFVKCVCGNWWQNSQNVTLLTAAHFYGLKFICFSVSLNHMETVLRFKLCELSELYEVQVLILYIYIYLYRMMLITDHWDNYLRFWCWNIWNWQKTHYVRKLYCC